MSRPRGLRARRRKQRSSEPSKRSAHPAEQSSYSGHGSAVMATASRPMAAKAEKAHQVSLDVSDQMDAAEHQSGIKLDERRARLDFREGGGAGIDAARADEGELSLHPHEGLGQHARGAAEQRPPRQPAGLRSEERRVGK